MNRKWVITKNQENIITTVFENEKAVELHCVSGTTKDDIQLGNIYIGRVKNIVHNINAAFIEISQGVECYYAIEENPKPFFTKKIGKKTLCVGDELLVQVSREAIKTKVPTVSSKLSFTGKHAVLTYGDRRIGVSTKLAKAEKERLSEIAAMFASDEYGIIMRTNAKEANEETLKEELNRLTHEYHQLLSVATTRTCYSCLKRAPKEYLSELRNIYQEGLTDIIIEDAGLYEEVHEYLAQEQPEDLVKLRLYQDKLLPLHKLYSIDTHIEHALKPTVWLKSGAYLVIQPTEALTVIDVNTGKCVTNKKDSQAYLKINSEAAIEVARQIRLRNLSGIIIIDFINMDSEESMSQLMELFQRELQKDPVTTTLVDVTKLQLVEVTRKKVRKPFHETISKNF